MLASFTGPLRLTNSTEMPLVAGLSASRRGAGDASCAAASGLNKKNRPAVSAAARLSRLRESLRACVAHSMTTAAPAALSVCSAAHKASPVRSGCTHTICEGLRPIAASASAFGVCGGWIMKTRRCPAAENIGAKRRSSPLPFCAHSSSTIDPVGQPPPGS